MEQSSFSQNNNSSSSNDSLLEIDEFDKQFLKDNPGIIESKRFLKLNDEPDINVNLTDNLYVKCKRLGLNNNRKGKIK